MEDTQQLDPISKAVRDMVAETPETPAEAPVEEVSKQEPVQETPNQDQPKETPQAEPTGEASAEPTEGKTDEPLTISFGSQDEKPEQVEEKFKELTSQRDALLQKLEERENAQVFANEQIRKLNDFVLNGGNIDRNFWELQEKDYSNVDFKNEEDMLRVLKDKYMLIDGLSEREATRIIQKAYPSLSDKDTADEDDLFDEQIQLKSAIRSELPKLQELQSKAALPKEDKEAQRRAQEATQLYQAEADKALSAINEFKLGLSDDFSINIAKDKETEKSLRNLILYPENQQRYFVDNYVKDGKVDFQRFARDEFFRIHQERIIKTAYSQGVSAGEKKIIQKELRQENLEAPKQKQSSNEIADYAQRIKQQLNPN